MRLHPRVRRGLIAFHAAIISVAAAGAAIVLASGGREPLVWYGVGIMLLSPIVAYFAGILAYRSSGKDI